MRNMRRLGLAAVVAAGLTLVAGAATASASSGVLCDTATNPCTSRWATGSVLDFSLKSGTSAKIVTTAGEELSTCNSSTIKGKLTSNAAGGEATVENTELTWGVCSAPITTLKRGKYKANNTGSGNGTLYLIEEIEYTVKHPVLGSCIYIVIITTDLGSTNESSGVLSVNAVSKKQAGSGALCPETVKWTGEYVKTEPAATTLYVSNG